MKRRMVSELYWGLILIAIGVLFLARNLGYIDFYFSMRTYWPVILIVVGVAMILKMLPKKAN